MKYTFVLSQNKIIELNNVEVMIRKEVLYDNIGYITSSKYVRRLLNKYNE